MISSLLLSAAAVVGVFGDDGTATGPPELSVYKSAAAQAHRDPGAHVRLALWCEDHGMTAERLKHLSLAVLNDPSNALARGLLGLVAYHGKWERPDVVGRQIQNDPARHAIVREYLDRRARTPDKAEAQMKLAAWCALKGLKEQALAHYSAVTRLEPRREAAWKHLGYKKRGNRWVKPEEVEAAKQEATRQKLADKEWKTKLEKLRDGLESKDAARRAKAEQGLTEVTDPRAVPMIWALFVREGQRLQVAAVQMLGQIDGPSASNGLAVMAVFSPAAEVRGRATETLARRDPRDVIGRLIGLVQKPYKYQVRHVNGPGSPGELFVEGERFNIQRFYQNQTPTFMLNQGRIYSPDVPFDPFNLRNLMLATIPNHLTGPADVSPNRVTSSYPFPVTPQSAALAGQAIAANPQNAAAILGQLVNNSSNRYGPPGYWFYFNQPNGVTPYVPVAQPRVQQNPASMADMEAIAAREAMENRAAINWLLANQQNPKDPLHQAGILNRLENNPANRQAGIILGGMETAQIEAAQRDVAIAQELEAIRQANQNLEQRLAMDVQFVEVTNAGINLCNELALPVLKAVTGKDLGAEPEKWKSWWTDQLGYTYQSDVPATKPTYTDFVTDPVPVPHGACFAAGTLVQSIDGPQPIESIKVGDQVLSQGTASGQLEFQPVLATHRNQPTGTLRIAVADESIVATGIHRFWKAGKGWTMARELKAGDRLRTVGGMVEVKSIETDNTQPVYNLDIAGNRDFFVGTKGMLVHDFSFVQPVLEPFDRRPQLATQAPGSE
jgi:Pretoxin HINT domain